MELKRERFKIWLANLGSERIDEVFDPEIVANRVINYYRSKGYSDEWIKKRLIGSIDRFKLTGIWKDGGIEKPMEYAMLTNEIYKGWLGMKAKDSMLNICHIYLRSKELLNYLEHKIQR